MATPTRIQSTGTASGSANTLSVAFGSNTGNNNTILAYAELDTTGASVVISDNVNNSGSVGAHYQVDASGTSSTRTIVIARFSNITAGATTVTVNFGSTAACRLVIQEWSGIDTLIPFEQSPAINGATSTTASNAAITPAETGELLVQWAVSSAAVTWTVGSGWTLDPNLANGGQRMAQYQVAGTSAVTPSMGLSSSVTWISVAAAYRSSHTRKVVAISSPGAGSFSAPGDWPGVADKAEAIGGGGAGCHGATGPQIGLGGGGGAYSYANAVTIANGASYQVGAGGATSGAAGTDSWIVSTSTLLAKAGHGAIIGTSGVGGAASSCVPSANAFSGGTGGAPVTNTASGASGGGGAAGPYGPGGNGGALNGTGTTGGTGGGGGGGQNNGVNQTASNAAGTAGGNYATAYGAIASTGGTGGASGGANGGGPGNFQTSPRVSSGSGGGGGSSDGSGNGGVGGSGGAGQEWFDGSFFYGAGGGGGGTGQATSGSTAGGTGGSYGGGGGGGGNGATTGFGPGEQGVIILTYTPFNPTMNPQWFYNRTYKQFSI